MPTLSREEWEDLIQKYFECPGPNSVYVLGCLATNVTLYSQQVRALNLIYGLHVLGRLKEGSTVAVIGGGAAGLTAAAAAQKIGCRVTLLERHGGPLEFQANNRQRWIHPRIYDWPAQEFRLDTAELPLLNWRAGYAEKVAEEIEAKWNVLVNAGLIEVSWAVGNLDIFSESGAGALYAISFKGQPGGQRTIYVEHIIVAIGFGVEEENNYGDSYWAEDNYDMGFRKRDERWLVSGRGDGALTDLMRLCIRRFRHDKILKAITLAPGIDNLYDDLTKLQQKYEDRLITDRKLSEDFKKYVEGGDHLTDLLAGKLRNHKYPVVLTSKTSEIYGGRSSILNRLIVAILAECNAFEFRRGPTGRITPSELGGFDVELGNPPESVRFDRVIARHGPASAIDGFLTKWFPGHGLEQLRLTWKGLPIGGDKSKVRLWKPNFFGPEGDSESMIRTQVERTSTDFGARIRALTLHKEIKPDGSSLLTYYIDGLSATDVAHPLRGLHIHIHYAAGKVGRPQFGEAKDRLGLSWVDDQFPEPTGDATERARYKAQLLSGKILLGEPLKVTDTPLSFTVEVTVLNGDAMTPWEFKRLYGPDNLHFDWERLVEPQEYTAAVIWCPIDQFTLKLTLPVSFGFGSPTLAMFAAPNREHIERKDVLQDSFLRLHPASDSRWSPSKIKWVKVDNATVAKSSSIILSTPGACELTVTHPLVGTCYTLTWTLPTEQINERFEELVRRSVQTREELLRYRDWRKSEGVGEGRYLAVDKLVRGLHSALARQQRARVAPEQFEVELMTFSETSGRLEYIGGTSADGSLADPNLDFWLPFGLGLAGACYKKGDRSYVYIRDQETNRWPEHYIPVRGEARHNSMMAFAIDHTGWNESYERDHCERARQCIMVVDISVRSALPNFVSAWFTEIHRQNVSEITLLRDICQHFCDKITDALGSSLP